MDIKEIRKNAREKMKGFCILCPVCDGVWCRGCVPGMGGTGSGGSFQANYNSLEKIKFILKTIHSAKDPKINTHMFGLNLSMPIFSAPITGTKFNMGGGVTEEEYTTDVISGSKMVGSIGMIGDTGDPNCYEAGLRAIKENDGYGIAIIKPRENEEIIKRIHMAEEANCIAVGVDLDGAGLITMKLFNQPVGPKSFEDLKYLVSSTQLPFIAKGIMSVEEAELCIKSGVYAIVVSNHGGRVLDSCASSVDVLPNIVKACKGKIKILVDGNVRSGGDVLKYLALGADGVLVGRPIIWGSIGGRRDGVVITLENLKNELYKSMILTGACDVDSVPNNIIIKNREV